MTWMMDKFLKVEDEVLVSPQIFEDKTHIFPLICLVIILSLVWA